jgi:peptidoglycan hydrolase-like protein with peptidoglycan-binding domain
MKESVVFLPAAPSFEGGAPLADFIAIHQPHERSAPMKLTAADRRGNRRINEALRSGGALRKGDEGAAAKSLERMLGDAGFRPGTIDRRFTSKTEASLVRFQASVGLKATGELDPATFKKLKGVQLRARLHKDAFDGPGQESHRIAQSEKRLALLGYDVGRKDGVFDNDLARAVKAFRNDQPGLKGGPGMLGSNSRRVLRMETRALNHAPEHARVRPSRGHRRLDALTGREASAIQSDGSRGLSEGAKGRAVKNLQAHLKAAGFDPQRIDGRFDERTAGALEAFQRKVKLPATGQLTPLTWARLKKAYLYARTDGSPAQYLNERSRAVLRSEKLLKRLGHNPGKVDGLFTESTLKASRAFERKHGFGGDKGAITDGQLARMRRVSKERSQGAGLRAVQVARRHLGFHERGVNGNPFSKYFGRPAEAWCADFVSYAFEKAGHPIGQKGVGIPYVPNMISFFRSKGKWGHTPKPGAVVVFNGGSHVGIVTSVKNGVVHTIEGNTSDGVYNRSYPRGSSALTGFGYW